MTKRLKAKYTDPIGYFFLVSFFTTYFVQTLAIKNADKIKSGLIDEYEVLMSNSSNVQTVALLGTSNRFSYFYHVTTKEIIVSPVENISFMRKVAAKSAEKDLKKVTKP